MTIQKFLTKIEETKQIYENNEKLAQCNDEIISVANAYSSDRLGVADSIKNQIKELRNGKVNRDDWEPVFKGFINWIDNIPSDYKSERERYLNSYINGCNVVGVSCTENSRTLEDNGFTDFDVGIIDEVSKATPPELLLPMLRGKKIILVGDHRQLPPLFNERENTYKEIVEQQSQFEDISVELKKRVLQKFFSLIAYE